MAAFDQFEPYIRRIIAPNPSAMTEMGTNTYLVGQGSVAVIDPGPDNPAHLKAILGALKDEEVISHVLVTHSHLDHSPLAHRLADRAKAPVLAFGPSHAGRSQTMDRLAQHGDVGGGEGIDADFSPDICLSDGEVITGKDWSITALHTPGHLSNHMCFEIGDVTFTGDHVMGWASSLVSPPDGDLGAFMASCRVLRDRPARRYYAGHGDPIDDPNARVRWLIDHRLGRESEILAALAHGPLDVGALTVKIYHQIDPRLHGAAARNVLAHLIDLWEKQIVRATPDLSQDAIFSLA